jgi:hypothetical protein
MAWKCSCGLVNSGINEHCAGQLNRRSVEHHQVSGNSFDSLMMFERRRQNQMTDNEDKFATFFSEESVVFSSLSQVEQISRIETLEEIAFETRARLTAAKSITRDQNARKRVSSDWSISPTGPDALVTDSINKVEQRKKRMSKLDKQSAKLAALGFSQKEIDAMTAGLRKVAVADTEEEKDKAINRAVNNLKDPPPPDLLSTLVVLNPKRPDDSPKSGQEGVAIPTIKPIEELTEKAQQPLTLSDLSTLKFK